MLLSTLFPVLAAAFAAAAPMVPRDVALDQAATAEAQVFDKTATRAFTATTITTSDGLCLSVDPFSGDFRENLTPVTAVECNGSANQTWDVITKGVHNNVAGQALIVSSLTNACLNFDPRRAAGNQVLLFSCGGRADGGGQVTNSQLFAFTDGKGALPLIPQNGNNAVCLTIKNGALDQTACNGAASATGAELFTFGGSGKAASGSSGSQATTTAAADTTTAAAASASCEATATVTVTQTVTVTDSGAATTNVAIASKKQPKNQKTKGAKAKTTKAAKTTAVATAASATAVADVATSTAATATSTGPIKVSGAGGTLNPTAVAEAQQKDTTATFAAQGVQIKDSTGNCLFVDETAGDFRENLIPVAVKACDGSEGQKFDLISKGVHNDQAGETLIVSSLTNGCLSFDSRRDLNTQVHIFSCGGRADGSGQVATSQLFPLTAQTLTAPVTLTPNNAQTTCFVNTNGQLLPTTCDPTKASANELFTIGA